MLRDFAHSIGLEEVSNLITLLIQSDQFSTRIGDALRVYAREMREKQVMRAQEKANKLALDTMGSWCRRSC